MANPKLLFSHTLLKAPPWKLYFIDLYETEAGYRYLSICENRKDSEGNVSRVRLFVDPGQIEDLRDSLDDVLKFLKETA